MNNSFFIVLFFLFALPTLAIAGDFQGAPVIPGGEVIERTEGRFEFKADSAHDQTLAFYENALKDLKDIKFRDWKDATYIEDDGNRPWHSITISKDDAKGATVVIMKDNWTWIIGTLVLRYIGVFVVLMVLFMGMSFSGKIISRFMNRLEEAKTSG